MKKFFWGFSLSSGTNYDGGDFDNLKGVGGITANNVNVKNSTAFAGFFNCTNCTLNKVVGSGSMTLSDSVISGPCTFSGKTSIDKCDLRGELNVTTDVLEVQNSKMSSIKLGKDTSANSQTIILDNTKVRGDIRAESGDARVILRNGSSIDGNVVGVHVINENGNSPKL